MRRLRVLLLLLLLPLLSCRREGGDAPRSLLQRLQEAGGMSVTAISPPGGYGQAFAIDFIQPVDHGDSSRGTFTQRAYLSYIRDDAPTVFYTTGYGVTRNYVSEPAALLEANQLLLVHRYFPDAVPSTDDWSFLTTAQAAADQHAIRTRLAGILTGAWVSSGASKGGMTALYYRYYHPDDVAATVAYVAPIMERTEDPRFVDFIRQVGSPVCRDRISRFQREVLNRRAAMLPLVHGHALEKNYSFTVISEAEAFEYSALEYPFAFWQYGAANLCDAIPLATASDRELFDHLVSVSPLNYYADADYLYFRPLFYQAYTEIGYCTFMADHLAGLLQAVPSPSYRAFAPRGVEMDFRPGVMQAVVPWLRDRGERILYVYGGNDPWTAGALDPSPALDALQVIHPGGNHGTKIATLDSGDRELALRTLGRWLGLTLSAARLPAQTEPPARSRF